MKKLGLKRRGGVRVESESKLTQASMANGEEGLDTKKGIGEGIGVENAAMSAIVCTAQIITCAPGLHDGVLHVVAKVSMGANGLGVGFKQGGKAQLAKSCGADKHIAQ